MAKHQTKFFSNSRQRQPAEAQKPLDLSPDVICAIDENGRFISVSAAAKNVWGYSPKELIGTAYLDLVVEADRAKSMAMAAAVKEGAVVTNFENHYRRKDGKVVPILWSAHWDSDSQTIQCKATDATQKRLADRQAKLYDQRLKNAYRLVQIGWWEWNALTGEYFLSDELLSIYGLSAEWKERFTRSVYLQLVHPDDRALVEKNSAEVQLGTCTQYDHRMIKPTGEVIYVIHYIECIRDESGGLVQVNGITKDISRRKKVEMELRQSEHRLSTILESIGDCFFAVDKNWTLTYFNHKAEVALQKKRTEVLGRNLWEVFPEARALQFYQEYEQAMRLQKPVHFEAFFTPLASWFEVSAYPSAEGLAVYFKDTTIRREQQEELRNSNLRYELVTKATSDAIWDWNLQTGAIFWGEGLCTRFGYPTAALASSIRAWKNMVHPDDLDRVAESLTHCIESTTTHWCAEYRMRRADGSFAIVKDKGFVMRNESGQPLRMVGALEDITQQREAELAVKLSEERYKLLFYQSPKPRWIFNAETARIVEVNEAAHRLYGYTKEEFLQLTVPDLKLPAQVPEFFRLMKERITSYQNIVQHRKKNGEVFSIDISTHFIDLPTGRHYIVTGDDVTEKLQLQQMILDEKVAAQKEVVKAIISTQERERSEIAKELHDNVNQLLTTAKLYIENIRHFPAQQDEFIQKGIQLLQHSINEIRTLSKQLVTPVIKDIGFKSTIEELLNHYASLNLFEIELRYDLCEENIDKELQLTIYRIVQEQLNNIVKYANASRVLLAMSFEQKSISIRVEDNGVGFDTNTVTRGLGLNNMRNRVDIFKGEFQLHSQPGGGTRVCVRFPLHLNQIIRA